MTKPCAYCQNPGTVPFSWYGETLLMCEVCMSTRPWEQKREVVEMPIRVGRDGLEDAGFSVYGVVR